VGKRKPTKLKMALESRRSLVKQAMHIQRELRTVQAELHKLVIEKRRTECATFEPVSSSSLEHAGYGQAVRSVE